LYASIGATGILWNGGCRSDGTRAMKGLNRRCFIWSGAALGPALAISSPVRNETVYDFSVRGRDVRMTVEFYDRHSSRGFRFDERLSNRRFCFSAEGDEGHHCLANFSGSIAIARYKIRWRSRPPDSLTLREYVRTIDQDIRLNSRPPFERTLELQGGLASDIQAFGYETEIAPADAHEPWCLLRQDLYFEGVREPFLVVHWKHTLSAIRLVDVIPGEETQLRTP
jgi:hypothetical protein